MGIRNFRKCGISVLIDGSYDEDINISSLPNYKVGEEEREDEELEEGDPFESNSDGDEYWTKNSISTLSIDLYFVCSFPLNFTFQAHSFITETSLLMCPRGSIAHSHSLSYTFTHTHTGTSLLSLSA